MAGTRSTFIPVGPRVPLESPTGGEQNRKFVHGEQFTAYDMDAVYLKANYVYDAVTNPNGVLVIVTETA